jgi:hypothetical protein
VHLASFDRGTLQAENAARRSRLAMPSLLHGLAEIEALGGAV